MKPEASKTPAAKALSRAETMLVREIARTLGFDPEGATLTYRGLWDLDVAHRRIHFGAANGMMSVGVPGLARLDPYEPGATAAVAALILATLDKSERQVAPGGA